MLRCIPRATFATTSAMRADVVLSALVLWLEGVAAAEDAMANIMDAVDAEELAAAYKANGFAFPEPERGTMA